MSAATRTERYYCSGDARETTWRWGGTQNHTVPTSVTWICTVTACGRARISLADVRDAEAFVRSILDRKLRVDGTTNYRDERSIDHAELLQDAWERLMDLYGHWDPERGVPFAAYAAALLPLRLNEWWRQRHGRDGKKPLATAVSLEELLHSGAGEEDGYSLAETLGSRPLDLAGDRDADLGRALLRRDRSLARTKREMGFRPATGAPGGDLRFTAL